jgi:hypothetical protein
MRVERNINTALVGCFSTCLCSTPRATAKEDSASLWDFYTFILYLYPGYLPPHALLLFLIIQNFYTKLHKTGYGVSQSIRIHLDTLQIALKVVARERVGEFGKTV